MIYSLKGVTETSPGEGISYPLQFFFGFPGGSVGKESHLQYRRPGFHLPGLGRYPGGGHGNPLQDSCMENPHGQRSLVGCNPCGGKELDITEQLNTLESYHVSLVLNSTTFS